MEVPANQRSIDGVKPKASRCRYRVKGAPGLILEVHPSGRRTWLVRYQVGSGRASRRQRWVKLGRADIVKLPDAIEKARRLLAEAVLNGTDPRSAEEPERTLNWLFEEWGKKRGHKLKEWPNQQDRWRNDIAPTLGRKLASEIVRLDVAKLRDSIEQRSPYMANRAVLLVNRVFNWAVDDGYLTVNPSARLRQVEERHKPKRVMSAGELRAFLQGLATSSLQPHTQDILWLLALTGQRRTEVANMHEKELHGDLWTIPAKRTKNGREHAVPLTATAANIVLRAWHRGQFPMYGPRGPVDPRSITRAMRDYTRALGIGPYSPHDLRRTMASGLAQLEVPREVGERVLNHTDQSVHAAHYNRHDYLVQKYRALCLWEEHVFELLANPSPLLSS